MPDFLKRIQDNLEQLAQLAQSLGATDAKAVAANAIVEDTRSKLNR